nr:hypothetical protein TetV2_00030 [Oceanusvirus sp.]
MHVSYATTSDGRVVAVEANSRTDGHAETRLLRRLEELDLSDDTGLTMTVVRVANTSRSGRVEFRNSKPCLGCRMAILGSALPIERICWSTEEGTLTSCDPKDLSRV